MRHINPPYSISIHAIIHNSHRTSINCPMTDKDKLVWAMFCDIICIYVPSFCQKLLTFLYAGNQLNDLSGHWIGWSCCFNFVNVETSCLIGGITCLTPYSSCQASWIFPGYIKENILGISWEPMKKSIWEDYDISWYVPRDFLVNQRTFISKKFISWVLPWGETKYSW